MKRTPVIGITAGLMTDVQDSGTFIRHRVSADYANAVRAAGGLPIILPPQDDTIDALLDLVDGLIFSVRGRYRSGPVWRLPRCIRRPMTSAWNATGSRSTARAAVERDLPILCICRGIQVLNVALGGSLVQHIDDQIARPLPHRQAEIGKSNRDTSHDVTLADGSLSAAVFGSTVVPVNSFHHQSLATPAPAIQVDGLTSDGVIEAVSVPSCSFVLGVQWHPELLFETMPAQLKPFEALVDAAKATALEPART